jgi:hypothetical protein
MVCKKIMIKNSANTLTGLVVVLLLVMGMFYAGFSYLKVQTDAGGITIPSKYDDTFTRLNSSQNTLKSNVDTIKANVNNMSEATSVYAVAWNGLKGLGNTLLLSITFISSAVDTAEAMFLSLDAVPMFIITLFIIGLTMYLVFLIISNLKGEPRT